MNMLCVPIPPDLPPEFKGRQRPVLIDAAWIDEPSADACRLRVLMHYHR